MSDPRTGLDEMEQEKRWASSPNQQTGHKQDDEPSETSDDEIFVSEGEAEYVQLSDNGDVNSDESAGSLDDAFEVQRSREDNVPEMTIDLGQAIDQRLFSELEERHAGSAHEHTAPTALKLPTSGEEDGPTSEENNVSAWNVGPIQVDVKAPGRRMPAEHVDQIKNIMAGVKLSNGAVPEWAKRIPEEAWMPRRKPE
ncbi:hypothetical protein GGF46_005339 [Coemansia sp. RSA 552]|nr:hypothetical protein GGF46_005339 [Coemansia sp. RSA 552]